MSTTKELQHTYSKIVEKATKHPFTVELCDGSLADEKLYVYLLQDYSYFKITLKLLAKALEICDHFPSCLDLGKQIGEFCGAENNYFDTCIKELEADHSVKSKVKRMHENTFPLPAVQKYNDYVQNLVSDAELYAQVITSIFSMEFVYLKWASDTPIVPGLTYKHQEWINLHTGEDFETWVKFLEREVNRVYTGNEGVIETTFVDVLNLEIEFFNDCYSYTDQLYTQF